MPTIFIDGREGTTGLQIADRLENRADLRLLAIDDRDRKDPAERKKRMDQADIVFLCLPDQAAREAVALAGNPRTRIIDASTAHRTNPDWAYGFPELSDAHRAKIRTASRIAVPGCHATGFLSLTYPLVNAGILAADYPLVCHSVTGYSGGGKKMIAQYEESPRSDNALNSPRQYGLALGHKHLPEMAAVAGLAHPPVFNPIVADFYCGMAVTVPLHVRLLSKKLTGRELHSVLAEHYAGEKLVLVRPYQGEGALDDGFLAANALSGKNYLEIFVCGNDEQILLCARFDNLGKGASGAAVQCMNLMLGLDETTGLL